MAKVPGIVGVYLKATEGDSFRDHTFESRRREANAAGLRVGAYHFARKGDVTAEASNFVHMVGHLDRRDLRPALDAEVKPGNSWEEWSREWNRQVWRQLKCLPIFYSYPYWIEQLKASKVIGAGLWLASFGSDDGHEHPYSVPAPWGTAVMHQFSSRARVVGVSGNVDISSARSLTPLLANSITGRL